MAGNQIRETVLQAASSLAANRLRSILTTIGVAVGVFSIIAVMTALDAVERSVTSGLSSLGANTFQIQKYPATVFGGGHQRDLFANRKDISWQQALLFRKFMGGKASSVGFMISKPSCVARYGNRTTNPEINLTGGDDNFLKANGFDLAAGRNLNNPDIQSAANVAILGNDVAATLFGQGEPPVGRQVNVDGKVYTVIGVFSRKGAAFGQSQDNLVLIPITRYLGHVDEKSSISVTVESWSRGEYQATVDQAIGAMRLARGLTVRKPNDFEIRTNESLIESFRQVQYAITAGAFIISFMALLTAGVGIMNIMLVSVTERTREIGIRMSVGAPRKTILRQFLFEALLLSTGGGILGIAAGGAAGNLIALNFNLPTLLPWGWMLASLIVCSGVGIAFGIFPAWKAASLDPVVALRSAK